MHGGFVHHGDYWDIDHAMVPDMHTQDNESIVCSKTITYLLDGTVGLAADLALIAQAAALAREVNQYQYCNSFSISHFTQRNLTFLVDDTYWNRGKSVRTECTFLRYFS
jgi:hypothetical protein